MKSFTVVICTYNRHHLIESCLKSILSNLILPKKIIIIDQNYDFLTYKKIINIFQSKNYKNYLIKRSLIHRSLTKSKNMSLKYINTKYVFFIDDDLILKKNYFFENIKLIFRKRGQGVSGVISNYENNTFKDFFYYIFNFNIFKDNRYYFKNYRILKKKFSHLEVFQLPGGMTCFENKIFKQISFDEKFIIHNYEDVEFNIRLRNKYNNLKLFINFKTEAKDCLKKSLKENILMRFYYLRLIYLRNRNFSLFFFYHLSFFGLIFSNIFNFKVNDYLKIYQKLKNADKKNQLFTSKNY